MTSLTIEPSKKLRYKYKTEPFSHQKKALTKLVQLEGIGALLMEMGTGKTKVAIDFAGIGFYNWGVRRVLVVAPLSVLGVWPRQIRQHSGAPARIFRLEGPTTERISHLRGILRSPDETRLTYLVINYEGIWRESDAGDSVEKLLIKWRPDLVIFDESHRLKSPSSKQSKSGWRIARESPRRLLLSGTPITKSPLDAFGQFRAMNDHIFGSNWYHFKQRYGVWGGFHRYQLRGYRHLQELIHHVRTWSYRIKKDQCLDLPEKVFETVPVKLGQKAVQIYRDMAEEMIAEIEEGKYATASIVLAKMTRLSQITSGFVKDTEGIIQVFDNSKLNTCVDLVDDILSGDNKVVIFVRFRKDIALISDEFKRREVKHEILSGSVPSHKRDSIIEQFQTDPELRVFVAQSQAGSLGIELFAANFAIFYSLSFNAEHYWQAQDRLHRQGQTRKVTYYHLVVPRTIDQVALDSLRDKKNLADTIIHNPRILLP